MQKLKRTVGSIALLFVTSFSSAQQTGSAPVPDRKSSNPGGAELGQKSPTHELDQEIEKQMGYAAQALESYYTEYSQYTRDPQQLGYQLPAHLQKLGKLEMKFEGSSYHIEFQGTAAPIQGKKYNYQKNSAKLSPSQTQTTAAKEIFPKLIPGLYQYVTESNTGNSCEQSCQQTEEQERIYRSQIKMGHQDSPNCPLRTQKNAKGNLIVDYACDLAGISARNRWTQLSNQSYQVDQNYTITDVVTVKKYENKIVATRVGECPSFRPPIKCPNWVDPILKKQSVAGSKNLPAESQLKLSDILFRVLTLQASRKGEFSQMTEAEKAAPPFSKFQKGEKYPKPDLSRLYPFGPNYFFQVEPNSKGILSTIFLYDRKQKPVGQIPKMYVKNGWFDTKKSFIWFAFNRDKSQVCRLQFQKLQFHCVQLPVGSQFPISLSPDEHQYFQKGQDLSFVGNFETGEVIWISKVPKVAEWKSESELSFDGVVQQITNLRRDYKNLRKKQEVCVAFIQRQQAQFKWGPYIFERKFERVDTPKGVDDLMTPAMPHSFSIATLTFKTDNPARDIVAMKRLDPNCEYLKETPHARDLTFIEGDEEYFSAQMTKRKGSASCKITSDCARNRLLIGEKVYVLNRETENFVSSLISSYNPNHVRIDEVGSGLPQSIVCQENQCRQMIDYQYPQGLLVGSPETAWTKVSANVIGKPLDLKFSDQNVYFGLARVELKAQATVQNVNQMLQKRKLKIHQSVREHFKLDLISENARTLALSEQMIQDLKKESIVVSAEPIAIPWGLRVCYQSGGRIESEICVWDDPQVDRKLVLSDTVKECSRVGGQYRELGSACRDSCESQVYRQPCADVITPGCDCGPNRCWHRGTCIQNPKALPQQMSLPELPSQRDFLDQLYQLNWQRNRSR